MIIFYLSSFSLRFHVIFGFNDNEFQFQPPFGFDFIIFHVMLWFFDNESRSHDLFGYNFIKIDK